MMSPRQSGSLRSGFRRARGPVAALVGAIACAAVPISAVRAEPTDQRTVAGSLVAARTSSDRVTTEPGRTTLQGHASLEQGGLKVVAEKITVLGSPAEPEVDPAFPSAIVAEGKAVVRLDAAARQRLGPNATIVGDRIITASEVVTVVGQKVTLEAGLVD